MVEGRIGRRACRGGAIMADAEAKCDFLADHGRINMSLHIDLFAIMRAQLKDMLESEGIKPGNGCCDRSSG